VLFFCITAQHCHDCQNAKIEKNAKNAKLIDEKLRLPVYLQLDIGLP
jgi:hypothetical protein